MRQIRKDGFIIMNMKEFGQYITRLINKEDLTKDETLLCFNDILNNHQSEMQQGAFLSALTAKGETTGEIAGAWKAIYELDTVKVQVDTKTPLTENSGTGMDTIKTFNISTTASIIAASDGIPMAKHGSRAITSTCGAVDIAEELGVNVECTPEVVKYSIEKAGIGLFNGMSPQMHPWALGRILSQISFGTTLNIAASLANPALPEMAVRGVYSPNLLEPTAQIMGQIGMKRALVVFGEGENGGERGMDEASTLGPSRICELKESGDIVHYVITPEEFGIKRRRAEDLAVSPDRAAEAKRMKALLCAQEGDARTDIVCLNAGLIIYLAGHQPSIKDGYQRARELVGAHKAIDKLNEWVEAQQ